MNAKKLFELLHVDEIAGNPFETVKGAALEEKVKALVLEGYKEGTAEFFRRESVYNAPMGDYQRHERENAFTIGCQTGLRLVFFILGEWWAALEESRATGNGD